MSYQVLARKYRPQQFDDVIAQEHVTRILKNALKTGRVSSGYLFTGPRGTGKTTTARILAKALNCVEGPIATPCEKCDSCKEIVTGSSLDVLEIDAASNTGVDDIRTLRENVRYLPATGNKRIYIIDEVHRLSGSAFDALLKTLEEPPAHVVFMFATTEPHEVPETIRSRTQRYDFHRVGVNALTAHLRKIAMLEKLKIDEEAIFVLARKADGSVRDGMSLLDQISAFSEEEIDRKMVIEALGLIDRQVYFEYVNVIAAKDVSTGLEIINNITESGGEIPEFINGLAQHFRNLLILKNSENPDRLVELSESEKELFMKQIDYFSTGDILRIIKMITNISIDLRSGIDERLLLETGTIRLATMESTVLFEDILAHLDAAVVTDEEIDNGKEKNLFGEPAPPVNPAPPPPVETTTRQSTPPPTETTPAPSESLPSGKAINLPIVKKNWGKYIEHLKTKSPMLSAIMAMAEITEVKGNMISAIFYNAGGTSKQVVEKPDYSRIILESLKEFFETNIKIEFRVDPTKKKLTDSSSKNAIENVDTDKILAEDERLRQIVERFDGEIVGKKKA